MKLMSTDTISGSILIKQSTKAVYLSGGWKPILVYGHAIRESLGGLGHIVKLGPFSYCAKRNQHMLHDNARGLGACPHVHGEKQKFIIRKENFGWKPC